MTQQRRYTAVAFFFLVPGAPIIDLWGKSKSCPTSGVGMEAFCLLPIPTPHSQWGQYMPKIAKKSPTCTDCMFFDLPTPFFLFYRYVPENTCVCKYGFRTEAMNVQDWFAMVDPNEMLPKQNRWFQRNTRVCIWMLWTFFRVPSRHGSTHLLTLSFRHVSHPCLKHILFKYDPLLRKTFRGSRHTTNSAGWYCFHPNCPHNFSRYY